MHRYEFQLNEKKQKFSLKKKSKSNTFFSISPSEISRNTKTNFIPLLSRYKENTKTTLISLNKNHYHIKKNSFLTNISKTKKENEIPNLYLRHNIKTNKHKTMLQEYNSNILTNTVNINNQKSNKSVSLRKNLCLTDNNNILKNNILGNEDEFPENSIIKKNNHIDIIHENKTNFQTISNNNTESPIKNMHKRQGFLIPNRISFNNNNPSQKNSNMSLRAQISLLVQEISANHKSNINFYNKGKDSNYNKIKTDLRKSVHINSNKPTSFDDIAKKKRNKYLNYLNKDGSLDKVFKTTNMKNSLGILRDHPPKEFKLKKRPTNGYEMNKILISSFGLSKSPTSDYSKKIYKLNETFFSLLKEMKQAKVELENEKFEKNKQEDNGTSLDIINEKNWEKKFMLQQYNDKLSEKEFLKFKTLNKIQQKKEIIERSHKLADLLLKMDAEEYEKPDDIFYEYKSSGSYISGRNVYRIRRVRRILENIEDNEQLGAYDVNVEKLRMNQKKSETEVMLAIKRSGKPRFVKTKFKRKTILQYKGVSGDYFGLPA